MKKFLEICQHCIFHVLLIFAVIAFICTLGGEDTPIGWMMLWLIACIVAGLLCLFVNDSRVVYRRLVPVGVCIASVIYALFKPVLKLHKPTYRMFKKCHAIKKLSGGFCRCYIHVQSVYDEYSNYMEDMSC